MSEHPDPQTASEDCRILQGDCFDHLEEFDENSFHAVVCDPPYYLGPNGFMPSATQGWDNFSDERAYQEWCQEWAEECLRVLKPGGHLIAMGGNTRHHRLFSGVEDAGFEIRDSLTYLYGTGFPKGATVSQWMDDDDAEQWSGYNTNLKPATEFAVLARAPLAEDAIYKNVITHGTGGLNVDSCRIPTGGERPNRERSAADTGDIEKYGEYHQGTSRANGITTQGRYPANLLLSHSPDCDSENDGCVEDCPIRMLDAQSGDCPTGDLKEEHWPSTNATVYGEYGNSEGREYRGDSGGASRFFYTSKASSSERSCNGEVENEHVAVKPLDLTEWLVTLVTAPGQRVLDPFAGSGTTIMACRRRGRKGVGIEQGPDHAELARERVAHAFNTETDFEGDVSPQAMNPETENDTSNASDATGTGDNVPTQPDLDAYGTSDDD